MDTFSWSGFKNVITEMTPTFKEIVSSYMAKDENTDLLTWGSSEIVKFLPSVTEEEAAQIGQDISDTVGRFAENMSDIQATCVDGHTKEEWLRDTLANNAEGKNLQEYAGYLQEVHTNIAAGNEAALRAMEDPNTPINITEEAIAETEVPKGMEWNRYTAQKLAQNITQQAELAGMNGMSVPVDAEMLDGMSGMADVLPPEMIEGTPSDALDNGVKMAAAAALKVIADTKKIPFLSKMLPIMGVANLACWAVEGAKCLGKCAMGSMSALQGLEHMKRASVAVMADLIVGGLAPKLFAGIPVIGMPLSFAASLILPNMATQDIHENLYMGVTKICDMAKIVAKGIAETVKGVFAGVKNVVTAIFA